MALSSLSDFMMNEEVSVQLVFPFFQIQRFMICTRSMTIAQLIQDLKEMDEFLSQFQFEFVFDSHGKRIDDKSYFYEFGDLDWIQIFVA